MNAQRHNNDIAISQLATWSLQGLLAGVFFAAGFVQLTGFRAEVLLFDEIGIGQWLRIVTGIAQIGGAIALVVPRTVSMGGISLTIMMAGAAAASFTVLPINPGPSMILAGLSLLIAYLRRNTMFIQPHSLVAGVAASDNRVLVNRSKPMPFRSFARVEQSLQQALTFLAVTLRSALVLRSLFHKRLPLG